MFYAKHDSYGDVDAAGKSQVSPVIELTDKAYQALVAIWECSLQLPKSSITDQKPLSSEIQGDEVEVRFEQLCNTFMREMPTRGLLVPVPNDNEVPSLLPKLKTQQPFAFTVENCCVALAPTQQQAHDELIKEIAKWDEIDGTDLAKNLQAMSRRLRKIARKV